jgi:hypothetical protein
MTRQSPLPGSKRRAQQELILSLLERYKAFWPSVTELQKREGNHTFKGVYGV